MLKEMSIFTSLSNFIILVFPDAQAIWSAIVAFGTISAGYFAYKALDQSNKQLKDQQKPYIVSGNMNYDKTAIQFKNIGNGVALNVFVSTDPDGKRRAEDPHLPENQYVESGRELTTLMTDPKKITVKDGKITLYIHYKDIFKCKYRTISEFKISGKHIKNTGNNIVEL